MCCRWVLLAGLVVFSHLCPAAAATVFTGRYHLTLGTPDRPIDDATVWIYVIGWGSVERVKAGVIRGGVFDARLDSAELPVLSPEIFLAAIEFSDGRWYRGPDFPPTANSPPRRRSSSRASTRTSEASGVLSHRPMARHLYCCPRLSSGALRCSTRTAQRWWGDGSRLMSM